MRTLVSNEGRVGYGYDKGEVPSFDEYVQRLSKYGLPEEYLYETLYELLSKSDIFYIPLLEACNACLHFRDSMKPCG